MANGALVRTSSAVTANAAARLIVAGNSQRSYLCIQCSGAADIEIGFDANLAVGNGFVLSPGSLGKQGGTITFDADFIPTNPIYAVSAAGSNITVLEG